MFYQGISGSLDVRGVERQRQGGWFAGCTHTHTHSYFTHSQYHIMFCQDISGSLDVRGGERQRQGGWFSGWQAEAGALKIIKAFQVEREAQGVNE